ncbi:AAA family ATPase [Streptomyces qinglanensis]|uniref:AAA family ATPase n=1 Tax=Streptomyces qinglanensis TaxID=943816 RepID=UPI003D724AF1
MNGLLGRFDHEIEIPNEQDFVILYGPNGIGKTKLLELINSTFRGRFSEVDKIPFKSAVFDFSDGSKLSLSRAGQQSLFGEGESLDLSVELDAEGSHSVWRKGRSEEGTTQRTPLLKLLRAIEGDAPISRISPDEWLDAYSNELLSADEVIERYAYLLPPGSHPYQLPDKISNFISSLKVHLIETQRLLVNAPMRPRATRPHVQQRKPTVEAFSEDFSRRIGESLAQNSRTSQERDRTFPRRLLSSGNAPAEATEEKIRERYAEQSVLRARLADISLLEQSSTDLPLPDRELKDWERLVLWTYLDDSDKKLANFQDLLERVELFRSIVNSRFQFKKIDLSRQGFELVDDFGRTLPVSSLSSGEQHELVLAYELLLNVEQGALVLIDEPEISLHVAWQQEFMNDIAKIASTASLRFVVATHSPQVIHKWWSRALALQPGGEEAGR